MTGSPEVYSRLKLLPAALVLLALEHDPRARETVPVRQVERHGTTSSWAEDEVTFNWGGLMDGRRSSSRIRLAEIARAMLDSTPINLRALDHVEHGTWTHFMPSLAVAWPDPPASIDELLEGGGWRELAGDAFRHGAAGDDHDDS